MFFITFEGIDQSGKSTQMQLLGDAMDRSGVACLTAREPGGTLLGERIRELLLGPEHAGMDPWAEALLYAAARVQLVREIIKPALMEGKIVLCDRFVDSSLVYQGIARDLGIEQVLNLNLGATGGLMPDLTFVFHLDVAISRERLAGREAEEDRIEGEPLEFHQKVEEGYRRLESLYPGRIVALNADRPVEEIHREVVAVCNERLELGVEPVEAV